jgi:hypothetical protein
VISAKSTVLLRQQLFDSAPFCLLSPFLTVRTLPFQVRRGVWPEGLVVAKRDWKSSMITAPSYEWELRAAEQRKRLHSSVEELKQRVQEKLDVKRNVRRHLGLAAGAVSVLGLALGYGVAGIFARH